MHAARAAPQSPLITRPDTPAAHLLMGLARRSSSAIQPSAAIARDFTRHSAGDTTDAAGYPRTRQPRRKTTTYRFPVGLTQTPIRRF